jgi:DNA polymerase-3 subunit delta
MPIHLYWGDDEASRGRAVEELVESTLDSTWAAMNLTRLDGQDGEQARRALEEARTPPLGAGGRVIVLQRSPFCGTCPPALAEALEACLGAIPEHTHLVLVSSSKPDARLRTTKALRALAQERSFPLPASWDGAGKLELVQRTARDLGLTLEPRAAETLAEAIGSDSARLASELEKLRVYGGTQITAEAVAQLVEGRSSTALAVGEALLAGRPAEAIALLDHLLAANEPALRIVASLTSQIRGWLWVALLDAQGEQDVGVIAKAAGIGNPKRIYVLRKQLRGRSADHLLGLLRQLLDAEAALKRGGDPAETFREAWLLPVSSPR